MERRRDRDFDEGRLRWGCNASISSTASKRGDIGRSVGVPDRECGGVGGSRFLSSLGDGSPKLAGITALSAGVGARESSGASTAGGGGGGTDGGGGGGARDFEDADLATDSAFAEVDRASDVFFGVGACDDAIMLSIGGGIPMRSRGEAKSIGPGSGRL